MAPAGTGGNGIEVLAQASLGAKEKAVIVRVDGERLLLGVATGQVTAAEVAVAASPTTSPPAVTSNQIAEFRSAAAQEPGQDEKDAEVPGVLAVVALLAALLPRAGRLAAAPGIPAVTVQGAAGGAGATR